MSLRHSDIASSVPTGHNLSHGYTHHIYRTLVSGCPRAARPRRVFRHQLGPRGLLDPSLAAEDGGQYEPRGPKENDEKIKQFLEEEGCCDVEGEVVCMRCSRGRGDPS